MEEFPNRRDGNEKNSRQKNWRAETTMSNGEEEVCKSKEKWRMKVWDFTQRRGVTKFLSREVT